MTEEPELLEVTKCVMMTFDALSTISSEGFIALSAYKDFGISPKDTVVRNVKNLAAAVFVSERAKRHLTMPFVIKMAKAIDLANVERPAVIPIDKTSCHQMSGMVIKAVLHFRDVIAAEGDIHLPLEALEDRTILEDFAKKIEGNDDPENFAWLAEVLVDSVDKTGYTWKQLSLLHDLTLREGIAYLNEYAGDSSANDDTASNGLDTSVKGVSLFDVAMFVENFAEDEAALLADRWRRERTFREVSSVGKDHKTGCRKRALYDLRDILEKTSAVLELANPEKCQLESYLESQLRHPRANTAR